MTNDLMISEPINVATVFAAGGAAPILAEITRQVDEFVPDVSDAAGRKEIAALAYKVSRSKTFLEDKGKELVSGIKEQAKVIDAERRILRDGLDVLRDKARQPLTDFEEAEEKRIAEHQSNMQLLQADIAKANEQWQIIPLDGLKIMLVNAKATPTTEKYWEEFEPEAVPFVERAIRDIEAAIEKRTKHDEEQVELEQLRKDKAECEAEDEKERIASEASERTREEEEDKRAQERREDDRRVREAEERADKAEQDKKDADAEAERREEAARQAERDRIESERLAKEEAERNRKADVEHRGKFNREAIAALVQAGFEQTTAATAIELIATGDIPHVTINY